MPSILQLLKQETKVECPSFLIDNIHYEVLMGSVAYGCQDPIKSDFDIYSFCIPPKEIIFPHLSGAIFGFDTNINKFEQWQQPHITSQSQKEYDITSYSIVKFFRLAANCTPNVIDSLYVPVECILHSTKIGQIVRENRKLFLSKKAWHTYKGYAFQQLSAAKNKKFENSKRGIDVQKYGYSLKHAYHIVRLISQIEQLLREGDMDLRRDKEHYKAIRAGMFTLEEIQQWFSEKEKTLEKLYNESTAIPHKIQEDRIKQLLIDCLEEHYGNLSTIIKLEKSDNTYKQALLDISKMIKEII